MAPAPYPDFRWLLRTLRVLPVVAIAALAGGIIGGFSIFAIDLAVTAPPNHGIPPEPGSKLAKETASDRAAAAPIRTFDAATSGAGPAASAPPGPPAPARRVATSPVVSTSNLPAGNLPAVAEPSAVAARDISLAQPAASAMTPAPSGESNGAIAIVHPQRTLSAAEPLQQGGSASPQLAVAPPQTAPDALSREPRAAPNTAAASAPEADEVPTAQKPSTVKGRAAIKPRQRRNERAGATAANAARSLYDDYSGRDEQDGGRGSGHGVADSHRRAGYPTIGYSTKDRTTRRQYDVRRQPPVDIQESGERVDRRLYDRSDDRDDDDGGDVLPAQPPPPLPFFGLFGGDR